MVARCQLWGGAWSHTPGVLPKAWDQLPDCKCVNMEIVPTPYSCWGQGVTRGKLCQFCVSSSDSITEYFFLSATFKRFPPALPKVEYILCINLENTDRYTKEYVIAYSKARGSLFGLWPFCLEKSCCLFNWSCFGHLDCSAVSAVAGVCILVWHLYAVHSYK